MKILPVRRGLDCPYDRLRAFGMKRRKSDIRIQVEYCASDIERSLENRVQSCPDGRANKASWNHQSSVA